jgi:hypothetical protein
MRYAHILAPVALSLALMGVPWAASAQQQDTIVAAEQLSAYARAFIAIGLVRDQIQAELALAKNKTPEGQADLREKLRKEIARVLQEHHLNDAEFKRITYLVSASTSKRKAFDELVAQITGVPTPEQQAIAAAASRGGGERGGGAAPAAGGAAGGRGHIDHVLTSFNDTPNRAGLLPTALAEARMAIQHATLASMNSSDLAAMKTHAGHVLHAVEPAAGSTGPGQGYGVKKAANNIANHMDMAAKDQGAPQNVTTHAVHIITSARNTVTRCDRVVAKVKEIQAATTAEQAAALVSELVSLTNQLVAGEDANGDGRIGWQEGEGGLQHVEEHLKLMTGT